MGEIQRVENTMTRGNQEGGSKPALFSMHSARRITLEKSKQYGNFSPTSGFMEDSCEEMPSPPCSEKDAEDEEDYDDTMTFENLSECMGSLTTDETNALVEAIDLYMQQYHDENPMKTSLPEGSVVTDSSGGDSQPLSVSTENHRSSTTQTPDFPRSLRKWSQCSTSESVDGIHLERGGFEPDVFTLDGVRKELFREDIIGCVNSMGSVYGLNVG